MNKNGRAHYKLEAWNEAMALVTAVYKLTQAFPKEELYGISAQMRRAAVSIPSNLAEGAARSGQREFGQFLSIARGSLSELETQLLISTNLGYMMRDHSVFELVDKVSRLITGLRKKVVAFS